MGVALGIDLGTTFTAAALARDGRVEVVGLGGPAAVLPTVVYLVADGTVLVGEAANRRAVVDPSRVAREFKRRLGDPAPLILGGTPVSVDLVMSKVLAYVVDTAARQEGEPPEAVALTHPASWGPYRTELLAHAASSAGLTRVELVPEPVAAAVDYASRERVAVGETIGVYDLGGGTFDASVVQRTDEGFELLGTPEGIDRLGGIDFDAAVLAHVDRVLDGALGGLGDDEASRSAAVRIRRECIEAKEALSEDTETIVAVQLPDRLAEVHLTRDELETLIRPLVDETVVALERAVRSAGLDPMELSQVLLVGGSSRIPLVSEAVTAGLGRPVAADAHPKHTVALGAARLAAAAVRGNTRPPPTRAQSEPDAAGAAAALGPGAFVVPAPEEPAVPAPPAARTHAGGSASRSRPARGVHARRRWVLPALVAAVVLVVAAVALVAAGGSDEPVAPSARITAIGADGDRYAVDFEASVPLSIADPDGYHLHFFYDTVPVADAGVPGPGPWVQYDGPSPVRELAIADRPPAASRICVLVARADHRVIPETGNCAPLP
jgi:actin-like ATPase involved in cell morphogenesis